MLQPHQYIERTSGAVRNETLFGDRIIRLVYAPVRENAPLLFRALTGARSTRILALFNYDLTLGRRLLGNDRFLQECGVDLGECLDPPEQLDTARKVFERKIRYWDCRPLPEASGGVYSPADARVLTGCFCNQRQLFLKGKFFDLEELLGDRENWLEAFTDGEFAIFRLTPDKYHYNHVPVSGKVVDFYDIDGTFHSCNPSAIVHQVTPYSKNRRVVTVIDTDVPGGTGVGLVAMIEIVALMIGEIVQCYSEHRYDDPVPVSAGQFLRAGCPKSLYRPGSSTDVLIFQPNRVRIADDLLRNQVRCDVNSRFSSGFGRPLVETDVQVRSLIARSTCVTDADERR
ncbi:MAG: phosphatidylserine decarboxylase [Syntrophotaleaceae bacterium]